MCAAIKNLWKSRKTAVLNNLLLFPCRSQIDGNFRNCEREAKRCDTWTRTERRPPREYRWGKLATAIRFERYDRREKRKKKNLTRRERPEKVNYFWSINGKDFVSAVSDIAARRKLTSCTRTKKCTSFHSNDVCDMRYLDNALYFHAR